MSTTDDFDGRTLRPGAFYWVRITLDPDTDDSEQWMNGEQPARYDGAGRWHFLGLEDASDWPVIWVGDEIQQEEVSGKPFGFPTPMFSPAEVAPFFHPDGSWNAFPFGKTAEEVNANLAKHFPDLA